MAEVKTAEELLKILTAQAIGDKCFEHLLGWMQQLTIEPVVCNLAGLCFSGGFNFVMSEFVIFNKKKKNTALIHNI